MSDSAAILAYASLSKAIAWPAAAIILAVILRPDLLKSFPAVRKLAHRIDRFKLGSAEISFSAADQQSGITGNLALQAVTSVIVLKDLPGAPRTEAMKIIEQELHQAVTTLTVNDDPVAILIWNLAKARLEAAFGLFYAKIFGSQIEGLAALSGMSAGASIEDAQEFFAPFYREYPGVYKDYGFEGWIGFMVDRKLIEQSGNFCKITPYGLDFLAWLRATGLSRHRPF